MDTPEMTSLIERLNAELDRREAVARAAVSGPWRWGNWDTEYGSVEEERRTLEHAPHRGRFPAVVLRDDKTPSVRVLPDLEDPLEYDDDHMASAHHITDNDPASALRLIEAHRGIVDECSGNHGSAADLAYEVLWVLAKGYSLLNEEGE